jgi:hypothetical protein
MGRLWGGVLLLLLSLFMLVGYLRADYPADAVVRLLFLLVFVSAPALGGAVLVRSWFTRRNQLKKRKDRLRRQTLESEVLKLARERAGSLTVFDLVTELAISREEAGSVLDHFAVHGVAETEIFDSGEINYTFTEVRNLAERQSVEEAGRR